jgi:hypothetical protein
MGSPMRISDGKSVIELSAAEIKHEVGETTVYRSPGGKLLIQKTLSKAGGCPPDSPECESSSELHEVRIERAGSQDSFTVAGGCGC